MYLYFNAKEHKVMTNPAVQRTYTKRRAGG